MINNSEYTSTKFITGMRAYAALAVFLVHSRGFGISNLNIVSSRIVAFGRFGVIAFFVLSAFTICMSIDNTNKFSFKDYMLKRFFRIAPMYYLILTIALLFGGYTNWTNYFKIKNDIYTLLYHFSFLNIFDIRHQNNLIGVEWSVPIEFIYYLIIPFLFMFYKKKNQNLIIGIIFSSLISVLGYFIYEYYDSLFSYDWSLIKYFFSFNLGVITYLIFKQSNYFKNIENPIVLQILILFSFAIFIILDFNYKDLFTTIFISLIILSCQIRTTFSEILFENKVIQFLGKISYSIYLIHMLILFHISKHIKIFQNCFIALLFTIIISSITYYLIEKPFIQLGKRILIKHIK